jgi:hypothetical protein
MILNIILILIILVQFWTINVQKKFIQKLQNLNKKWLENEGF